MNTISLTIHLQSKDVSRQDMLNAFWAILKERSESIKDEDTSVEISGRGCGIWLNLD